MPYNFTLPRDDDYITKGFQEGVQLGVKGREMALERRKLDQDESYRRALLQERALERQQEQEQLRALSELSSTFPMGVGGAQQAQTYDEAIREFSTPSAPSASPSDIVVQQYEWMAANAPKFLALKDGPRVLSALGAISDNYRQTISAFRTNVANVKIAQDNYNLIEKYKVDTPETRALHNQDKSIQRIQEFFTKNKIPFQEIPEGIIEPSGFINEVNFHNWVTRVQASQPQQEVSFVEDPATGQRYAIRGGNFVKSGISTEAEEAKVRLDTQLDALQTQMRAIASDTSLAFKPGEREKRLRELEEKQQTIIKQHYDSLRSNVNRPASAEPDKFISTDSPPVTIRVAPNGRRVIYDSVTKKPLRYAD